MYCIVYIAFYYYLYIIHFCTIDGYQEIEINYYFFILFIWFVFKYYHVFLYARLYLTSCFRTCTCELCYATINCRFQLYCAVCVRKHLSSRNDFTDFFVTLKRTIVNDCKYTYWISDSKIYIFKTQASSVADMEA